MSENRETVSITPDFEAELVSLLKDGKTIEAIKRLRERAGVGLADSKAWVEARMESMSFTPKTWPGIPCPYCDRPLRTDQARQCFECGMDWHDVDFIVKRTDRSVPNS